MNTAKIKVPEWADYIAVDENGEIWAFEEDCFYASGEWLPIDDFDGLQLAKIGQINVEVSA